MKKIIGPVLFAVFIALLLWKYGENAFIPGSVSRAVSGNVSALEKTAQADEEDFRTQMEAAEKTSAGYEKLGRKYAEQRSWTPAVEALSKALEYGGGSSDLHYILGAVCANRAMEEDNAEDIKKAELHYRKALEKNPGHRSAAYGLGLLTFYLKKDRAAGIDLMKKTVQADENFYEARFALARFYYENSEPSAALKVYEDLSLRLDNAGNVSGIKEMQENCRNNISRISSEITGG